MERSALDPVVRIRRIWSRGDAAIAIPYAVAATAGNSVIGSSLGCARPDGPRSQVVMRERTARSAILAEWLTGPVAWARRTPPRVVGRPRGPARAPERPRRRHADATRGRRAGEGSPEPRLQPGRRPS